MTVGTGNFPELLWPGIKSIWQNEYDDFDPIWSRVFGVKDSDKSFEKEQGVVGLPLAGIKDQGSPIPFLDPLQGHQQEYVNVTYALGSSITREMYEDDQYNVINQVPMYLARSLRQTEETVHHDVYNNGFSTELSADGVSIFNNTHTMIGTGTTQSNRGQTGVSYALSQTSLEQACIFIRQWTDDQDLKINQIGIKLFVPPDLWFTGEKVLETKYEVNTANNTINPVYGKMELIVSNYLTDTDGWFVVTDVTTKMKTGFVSYQRRKEEIQRDNEFLTQNLLFTTSKRFDAGATDWRGGWGTPGAA